MKRLVFDLRDNPGGPLDQAIRISNRFLPRGDMIVYTRGRVPNSDQDYRATEESEYTHLPMVVLVNRNSASASEIVSGALQDHDRGAGRRRDDVRQGAGAVGLPRSASSAGLALTTGRYYTPSGRMIQRPWDGAFDEYLTYTLRDQNAERAALGRGAEVHRRRAQGLQRRRHRARQVHGRSGRGLQPDAVRPSLLARGAFANFADQFTAEGDTRLSAANKNKKRIAQGLHGHRRDAAGVPRRRSRRRRSRSTRRRSRRTTAFIRAMIHYDIDLALFGVEEARRNLIRKDPQAQFALQQFGEAQR